MIVLRNLLQARLGLFFLWSLFSLYIWTFSGCGSGLEDTISPHVDESTAHNLLVKDPDLVEEVQLPINWSIRLATVEILGDSIKKPLHSTNLSRDGKISIFSLAAQLLVEHDPAPSSAEYSQLVDVLSNLSIEISAPDFVGLFSISLFENLNFALKFEAEVNPAEFLVRLLDGEGKELDAKLVTVTNSVSSPNYVD